VARLSALVIGGSVGGLFAANLLRSAGWDVTVFERAEGSLGDRGAGIGTRDELFAVLRRACTELNASPDKSLDASLDPSLGVEVRSRLSLDRDGEITREVPLRAVTSCWARIYRPLRAALPSACYRAGATLDRVEQDRSGVTAILADGTHARGDLLVGADGLRSTVRQQLLPDLKPRYAGYVAWRGVVDERQLPDALHDTLLHHMIFCFTDDGMALSIPMPTPDQSAPPGTRACHFVWFRSADYESTLPLLCTDAAGRRHGDMIPPPLIRPELVNELRERAADLLPPQIAALVARAPRPFLQPIFELESPSIVFGRVALLGDAAFVARPHVATGVTKAALDAQCLVDALAARNGNIDAALARYDRERWQYGNALVARGRRLGTSLEAQLVPRQGSHMRLDARCEIIMREYGAAGVASNERVPG
jgi:2-polyprenyl-6-methoxyphenol hydroxylase-like FAD-dependent oxidoreductase